MSCSAPRVTAWSAALYPVALAAVALLFHAVGERWWLTGVALYAPRALFGLPLAVLVPALWLQRQYRLLWTQALALGVLLFPLLGLVLPHAGAKTTGPTLRVLTYNVNSSRAGFAAVADSVLQNAPDIVVMQEQLTDATPLVARLAPAYPTIDVAEQFVMASRFPLLDKTKPPIVNHGGYLNTPHVVRYELDTPFGPLAVITLHPISQRSAIRAAAAASTHVSELLNQSASETRLFELAAALELAQSARMPVVIAGDTNLPSLSPMLDLFGAYQDGFESAGWGFGYTFPSRFGWLRLDRILASPELAFVDFDVDCGVASDHRCVLADLARRAR